MNGLKRIYHFLGGIRFAIILITLAATSVIAGTLLESKTESHLLAAKWTYGNPLFLLLLCLFFINILVSALRRWPFKKKHIPFLMTHLGLLMIITGTILKNRYGLQGNLSVWEGSGNQHVLIPHSHAIYIEKKDKESSTTSNHLIPLDSFHRNVFYPAAFPELKCKLTGYAPHVKEYLETWIKGSKVYAAGLPLFSLSNWQPGESLPDSLLTPLTRLSPQNWELMALHTEAVETAMEQLYLHQLNLRLAEKEGRKEPFVIPVEEVLKKPFFFSGLKWNASLNLTYSMSEGFHASTLHFESISQENAYKENVTIALNGQESLYVQSTLKTWSEPNFTFDLTRSNPLLAFIEDHEKNVFIFAFDQHGRVHGEKFDHSELQSLIAYDQGYAGYAIQTTIPYPTFPASRDEKESADAYALALQLKQAMEEAPPLSPPLDHLKRACAHANVDFSDAFVQFLLLWNRSPRLLLKPNDPLPKPLEEVINQFDWTGVSDADLKGSQWTVNLLHQLDLSLKEGEDPLSILSRYRWPFLSDLKQGFDESQHLSHATIFAQQVFSIISYLPSLPPPDSMTTQERACLLSAYLRGYGIDSRSLFPLQKNPVESFDALEAYWTAQPEHPEAMQKSILLETSLTSSIQPEEPPLKLEEHCPGIVLEFQEGGSKQVVALPYDSAGTGLKWPLLNGSYVARFQPRLIEIPYRVRLRQARQISYPNSPQVYSYESDLLIAENGQEPKAQTLSMNHVHETWDGYRFYLAGIASSGDQGLKRIQLVVNHDPAKYYLTYPGALLVFLGALSLFWGRPYKN